MRQTARDRDAAEEMRSRRRSKADDMVYDEQKMRKPPDIYHNIFFCCIVFGDDGIYNCIYGQGQCGYNKQFV